MNIFGEIIAGIAVAILSGIGGFFIKQRFFRDHQILPRRAKRRESESYTHLNGEWNLYFLSRDSSISNEPIWFCGIENLDIVSNNQVVGSTKIVYKPGSELDYEVHGEIRHGRMILTDNCLQDETEFASVIFPNLRSAALLVGIWTGFDNDVHLISGPAVLSRSELDERKLNGTVRKTPISLVTSGIAYSLSFTNNHLADE